MGKQYRVESGAQVRVESLVADVGAAVAFEEVLLVGNGDQVKVGAKMRMTFRIRDNDTMRGGFKRYFWKAAPV